MKMGTDRQTTEKMSERRAELMVSPYLQKLVTEEFFIAENKL